MPRGASSRRTGSRRRGASRPRSRVCSDGFWWTGPTRGRREAWGDARAACPRGAGRLQVLLAVLAGDLEGPASLLARAPGLGGSRDAGQVLFPVLSWALGGEPPGSLREAIAGSLHRAAGTVLEVATADGLGGT